ncbi:flagellar assembly peptidoglycan hydrolase FlgJ [Litoribrevibacter albus]|uniref:Peptidoglycan hydrolase FlgJ n=1 Tax=Litoribrevibacter albus TaxID=1473156 RepID=A0AA37W8N9_9GAMM|nr:flagellar assembly peptidoglycan hydrolase FlgJ [Litoribrevibacter albus]GLQ32219.1 peptidoglycan hydrolase FlgJ [Litoribrevibacter albus]
MKSNFDTSSLGNYHDLNSLQNLKAKSRESDEGKLEAIKNVAKQFESMFVGMMLKSMRDANATFEEDNPLNSSEMKMYRDMYDQQLSMHLSEGRGIGIADSLVRQLSQQIPELSRLNVDKGRDGSGMEAGLEGQMMDALGKDASLSGDRSGYELKKPEPFGIKLDSVTGLPFKNQEAFYGSPDSPQAKRVANAVKQYMDSQNIQMYAEDEKALKAGVEQARNKRDAFESPEDFVSTLWPVAQVAARKLNADPKALLAQAALETGWGKKVPQAADGQSSFNLFGIKADRSWQGDKVSTETTEYDGGIARKEQADFRSYGSYVESMLDYTSFLQSRDHYQAALKQAEDAQEYLSELQNAGYATDPNYATKIVRIMNGNLLKDLSGRADI